MEILRKERRVRMGYVSDAFCFVQNVRALLGDAFLLSSGYFFFFFLPLGTMGYIGDIG